MSPEDLMRVQLFHTLFLSSPDFSLPCLGLLGIESSFPGGDIAVLGSHFLMSALYLEHTSVTGAHNKG